MNIALVLPTYNERENVKYIIPQIYHVMPDISLFVVDDNSPDGTAMEVQRLMTIYSNLFLISRSTKMGLGAAYKHALSLIIDKDIFDAVIIMDADGSHSPNYLPQVKKKLTDYDIVVGSRYVKGGGVERWEMWRRALSYCGNMYAGILTGLFVRDMTAGFMGMRKEFLTTIDFSQIPSSGYAFLMELKFLAGIHGFKIHELPIIFKERREGESKLSSQIISEGLITPWRLLWKKITK